MGSCYLCSRSELFRALYIETGSRMLFISPPEGFIEWFRRVIPTDHFVAEDMDSIPEGRAFDHIVLWISKIDDISREDVHRLIGSYSGERGIWIGFPAGDGPKPGIEEISHHGLSIKDPALNLSTDHDIYRAWTEKDDE